MTVHSKLVCKDKLTTRPLGILVIGNAVIKERPHENENQKTRTECSMNWNVFGRCQNILSHRRTAIEQYEKPQHLCVYIFCQCTSRHVTRSMRCIHNIIITRPVNLGIAGRYTSVVDQGFKYVSFVNVVI